MQLLAPPLPLLLPFSFSPNNFNFSAVGSPACSESYDATEGLPRVAAIVLPTAHGLLVLPLAELAPEAVASGASTTTAATAACASIGPTAVKAAGDITFSATAASLTVAAAAAASSGTCGTRAVRKAYEKSSPSPVVPLPQLPLPLRPLPRSNCDSIMVAGAPGLVQPAASTEVGECAATTAAAAAASTSPPRLGVAPSE